MMAQMTATKPLAIRPGTAKSLVRRLRRVSDRVIPWCFAAAVTVLSPAMALAQDDDREIVDARLEGYPSNVSLEGTTALMWVLLLILGIVCIGPLFMNSKRTHLD